MGHPKSVRDKIHDLAESINGLEYLIELIEVRKYRFDDSDAPQYVAEMKKAVQAIRSVRDDFVQFDRYP